MAHRVLDVSTGILVAELLVDRLLFMALKRFAEYRHLKEDESLSNYRKSLAFFTPELLLFTVVFYASSAMLFFGHS